MGNHRQAWACTPWDAAHVQTNSLHPIRYLCCTLHSIALMLHPRLQTVPSLAWRLHRRPEHAHGMLGDGQPPPGMGMLALKSFARATNRLRLLRYPRRVHDLVAFVVVSPLANGSLARMAAEQADRACPRHGRRWTTTATCVRSRPQKMCTCNQQELAHTLPAPHVASFGIRGGSTLANGSLACAAAVPAATACPWHARRRATTAMCVQPRLHLALMSPVLRIHKGIVIRHSYL